MIDALRAFLTRQSYWNGPINSGYPAVLQPPVQPSKFTNNPRRIWLLLVPFVVMSMCCVTLFATSHASIRITAVIVGFIAFCVACLHLKDDVSPERFIADQTAALQSNYFQMTSYDDSIRALDGHIAFPIACVRTVEGIVRVELTGPITYELARSDENEWTCFTPSSMWIMFHEAEYRTDPLRRRALKKALKADRQFKFRGRRHLNPDGRVTVCRPQPVRHPLPRFPAGPVARLGGGVSAIVGRP